MRENQKEEIQFASAQINMYTRRIVQGDMEDALDQKIDRAVHDDTTMDHGEMQQYNSEQTFLQEDSIFKANEESTILANNNSIISSKILSTYTDKDIQVLAKYKLYAPKVELTRIVKAHQLIR